MVIGNGLLAKEFDKYSDDEEILIFASGVSNSTEKRAMEFNREEYLLKSSLKLYSRKLFIYFSSCDVANSNVNHLAYYRHKAKMEKIVEAHSNNFIIFRFPQVVGFGGNSNNLLNYFVNHIVEGKVLNAYSKTDKNILDIDDVLKICNHILENKIFVNRIVNVINNQYFNVLEIIKSIELVFELKSKTNLLDLNLGCKYQNDLTDEIILGSKVDFNDNYIDQLINKYFLEQNIT